jgi:hypothetical protein
MIPDLLVDDVVVVDVWAFAPMVHQKMFKRHLPIEKVKRFVIVAPVNIDFWESAPAI